MSRGPAGRQKDTANTNTLAPAGQTLPLTERGRVGCQAHPTSPRHFLL